MRVRVGGVIISPCRRGLSGRKVWRSLDAMVVSSVCYREAFVANAFLEWLLSYPFSFFVLLVCMLLLFSRLIGWFL